MKTQNLNDDSRNIENWSLRKKIIFSILPLLILFCFTETALRFVYFQKFGKNSLAVVSFYREAKYRVLLAVAKYKGDQIALPTIIRENVKKELLGDNGKELFEEFQADFVNNLKEFAKQADKVGSKFCVIYIPPYDKDSLSKSFNKIAGDFFNKVCIENNISFISFQDLIKKYPKEIVKLLPEDPHLSRFGNRMIAKKLGQFIDNKFGDYRTNIQLANPPKLFGDLQPNLNVIKDEKRQLPYRLVTNSQGLRMDYDLTFPKKKQRILIMGPSYTFGPYVPNSHTYVGYLNYFYPEKEFINAARAGYYISDSLSLFIDRSKFVEPDITILQIGNRDITTFTYKKNLMNRNRVVYEPGEIEKNFLNKLEKIYIKK